MPPLFRDRIDILIRFAFGILVLVGCFFVLQPFLTSILLSAVLTVVTWPLYIRALHSFGGNKTIASLLLVTVVVLTVILPLFVVGAVTARQIPVLFELFQRWIDTGMQLPEWLTSMPYVGDYITRMYSASNVDSMNNLIHKGFDPLSDWVLSFSFSVGSGLVQVVLVAFVSFFFYRDGDVLVNYISHFLERISGGLSREFNQILINTTRSVVFGVIGTAVLQGLVAGIGFLICNVPGVMLLSFSVCILSVIPMGPPLVWLPVSFWLYANGQPGYAIFLIAWGTLAVSSVDSFIKPILISRNSSLPISLVFLGVFGGIISFGFLGLVLGPIFLAATMAMFHAWIENPEISKSASKDSQAKKEN